MFWWKLGHYLDSWMPSTHNHIWVCPSAPVSIMSLRWWQGGHVALSYFDHQECNSLLAFRYKIRLLLNHQFTFCFQILSRMSRWTVMKDFNIFKEQKLSPKVLSMQYFSKCFFTVLVLFYCWLNRMLKSQSDASNLT